MKNERMRVRSLGYRGFTGLELDLKSSGEWMKNFKQECGQQSFRCNRENREEGDRLLGKDHRERTDL